MNESSARKVLLLQVLETAQPNSAIWADEDASWASRIALTDKAAKGKFESFIVRRAEHAFKRIDSREPALMKWLSIRLWHSSWVMWALPIGLLIGVFANSIGSNQHINLLNPPILVVVLWNITAYILLLAHFIKTLMNRSSRPGILVQLTQRALRKSNLSSTEASFNGNTQIVQLFDKLWLYCSASMSVARAATLLHTLAAALALGLIAGLYLRGLVFDYRAAWESTFLSANSVHEILSIVLAPAIALSGITLPDVAAFDSLRMAHGSAATGVSAAPWIHLYSITLLLIIVLPRSALMMWNMLRSHWLAVHMALPLDNEYFARLKRQHDGDVPPKSIGLGYVSHTKVGKSTLMHAHLGRNMDMENDAHQVNKFGSVHLLIETPHSEQLLLWDIPDLGDSMRIAKRLHESINFLGRFKSQVWDRWRDSTFWDGQQMAHNIRNDADVILYIVDETESPNLREYLPNDIKLLEWIGRPVIVLLNQTKALHERDHETTKIEFWNTHLANHKHVKAILSLNEVTSCWVQEDLLFHTIDNVLVGERHLLMIRLRTALQIRRRQVFDSAISSLARSLARLANDFELVPESQSFRKDFREISDKIGITETDESKTNDSKADEAQKVLTMRLESEVRTNTRELFALHGLNDQTHQDVLAPQADHFEIRSRLNERKTTIWSGITSGALAGLAADLAFGGLTLGGGLIVGGVLGGLSGKGLARSVNLVRGNNQSKVMWETEMLNQLLAAALLRYIAVIQFGRKQDEVAQIESSSLWQKVMQQSLNPHQKALAKLWKLRNEGGKNQVETEQIITAALEPIISQALNSALHEMYPNSPAIETLKVSPNNPSKQHITTNG